MTLLGRAESENDPATICLYTSRSSVSIFVMSVPPRKHILIPGLSICLLELKKGPFRFDKLLHSPSYTATVTPSRSFPMIVPFQALSVVLAFANGQNDSSRAAS